MEPQIGLVFDTVPPPTVMIFASAEMEPQIGLVFDIVPSPTATIFVSRLVTKCQVQGQVPKPIAYAQARAKQRRKR